MKIAVIVARILLGLAFTVAGLSGFILSFGAGPPPMPGLAGQFQTSSFIRTTFCSSTAFS